MARKRARTVLLKSEAFCNEQAQPWCMFHVPRFISMGVAVAMASMRVARRAAASARGSKAQAISDERPPPPRRTESDGMRARRRGAEGETAGLRRSSVAAPRRPQPTAAMSGISEDERLKLEEERMARTMAGGSHKRVMSRTHLPWPDPHSPSPPLLQRISPSRSKPRPRHRPRPSLYGSHRGHLLLALRRPDLITVL